MRSKIKINWNINKTDAKGDRVIGVISITTMGLTLREINSYLKPQYVVKLDKYLTQLEGYWSYIDYTDMKNKNIVISNNDYGMPFEIMEIRGKQYLFSYANILIERELLDKLHDYNQEINIDEIENDLVRFYVSVFLYLAEVMSKVLAEKVKAKIKEDYKNAEKNKAK